MIDLPGIYSLSSLSDEEKITKNTLLFDDYEKIIYVCDASSLEKNLNLLLQILQINRNIILCINMIDEVEEKEIKIDYDKLENILNIKIVKCSTKNKIGINEILDIMDKDTLKMLANKLMFTMDEREYDTLLDEFDTILKQMDLIGNIPNIKEVEPMVYPKRLDNVKLREDDVMEEMDLDDILVNSGSTLYNQVKLPKVVE